MRQRHVLWLLGRRMTTVYVPLQLQTTVIPEVWTHHHHHQQLRTFKPTKSISTLGITGKKKDFDLPPSPPVAPPGSGAGNNNFIPPSSGNDGESDKQRIMRKEFEKKIVVKPATNQDTTEAYKNDALKLKQRIGLFRRRFRLTDEIQDSNGKKIYIPPRKLANGSTLPQIRAGAWLDQARYCRGGGDSIAGSEASRSLLRGKKDLMAFLRYAVHSHQAHTFVLLNHGVPQELLQHNVDLAARMLIDMSASECLFKQQNYAQKHNSPAAESAVRDLSGVRIRDNITGETRALSWPYNNHDWQHDLQLYWAVMNRIATRIGVVVLWKRPREREPDAYRSPESLLSMPPLYWKVEFTRGLHYDPEVLPPSKHPQVHPVIKWEPLQDAADPGQVYIQLQGHSTQTPNNEPMAVSLLFNACFRSHLIIV